ncbi:MAG: hypothetical protein Q8941_16010 [Bacteroidota bacterium]|nr:hypothetical protein [Bacteroidota bacterium]
MKNRAVFFMFRLEEPFDKMKAIMQWNITRSVVIQGETYNYEWITLLIKNNQSLLTYYQNLALKKLLYRKNHIGLSFCSPELISNLRSHSEANSCDKTIPLSGLLILNRTSYDEQEFYSGTRPY